MRLYSPEYLKWLLLCAGMIALAIYMFKFSQKRLTKAFGDRILGFLTQSYSPQKARLRVFFDVLVVAFLILALARPQAGQSTEKQKSEGIEIVFLMDVSPSMLVEDLGISRLDYAKIEASKLVDKLQGSKIGIVALSGSASVVCPMTPDPQAVKMYLDGLLVSSVSTQGTDFKKGFEEVIKTFNEGGTGDDDDTPEASATKALVLFSDGENHEEGAEEEIEQLKKHGIKVFTVIVGTEKGGTIPERDNFGNLHDSKKDRSGQIIISKINPDLMLKLAEKGDGAAFHFTPGSNQAEALLQSLEKLEKGEFDSQTVTKYEEKFH